jgi:hypothetical protein
MASFDERQSLTELSALAGGLGSHLASCMITSHFIGTSPKGQNNGTKMVDHERFKS